MKNILNKIKVHNSVYVLLVMALLAGYIKNSLIIVLIIFIHEMGHIFFIKLFRYEISSLTFYPFGGVTRVNKLINSSINKELLITLGGVVFQFILEFVVGNLRINVSTLLMFKSYNRIIIIFNLLPIIPLDGSIILRLFLEKFLSYRISYYIYLVVSVFSCGIFLVLNRRILINNLVIVFLLIYKMYEVIKNFKYVFNRFLLERYLYDLDYKKIVTKNKFKIGQLGKEKYYFLKKKDRVYSEKTMLRDLFDRY